MKLEEAIITINKEIEAGVLWVINKYHQAETDADKIALARSINDLTKSNVKKFENGVSVNNF